MNIDWSKAPEGATHFDPMDQNHLRQLGSIAKCWSEPNQNWTCKGWQYPDDLSTMPRLIARPAPWNGEGLPPVGATVEICQKGFGIKKGSEDFLGLPVRVAATFTTADLGIAMIAVDGGPSLGCEVFRADMARPIRTSEQIAAEERQKGIEELGNFLSANSATPTPYLWEAAQKIYDAGYRKQATPCGS